MLFVPFCLSIAYSTGLCNLHVIYLHRRAWSVGCADKRRGQRGEELVSPRSAPGGSARGLRLTAACTTVSFHPALDRGRRERRADSATVSTLPCLCPGTWLQLLVPISTSCGRPLMLLL